MEEKRDNIINSSNADNELMFIEYRKDPSVSMRNTLVGRYLYLAEIISKKFTGRGVDYEDIYQIACIALIKAVERFDPDKGVKFVSFATPTIIGEIKRFFRDKASVIRIPRRIYEVYQKVNYARDYLTQELSRIPRADEIARHLNLSVETVLEIIESVNTYNIQSINQNVYENDDMELHETLGNEDASFEKIENRDFLEKSLDKFNDAEKEFIKLRYFKNKTQKEIADKLGVSQMYISRLERKVLEKFRLILGK
ncbi:MAG: SigB/SigF/SigG family RNA polymerase sigma factor [Bacillota bacterium]|nr:SigB/SigF/SigG family RNA polymerase sigma factor [Bacillota bacterium]